MQEKIFKDFVTERNLSSKSIKQYKFALQDYTEFNKLTLTQLIQEADQEEEERIRAKKREIVKRLSKLSKP